MTRDEKKEYNRKYYQANREKILEQQKQYNKDNAEYFKEYKKQYSKTPMGKALYLLNRYNQSDKKHNRGKGDLTAKWIVDNIFSKPCHYCGKTDWRKIGCDRINNSKPHTEDNVVPCCEECNRKRQKMDYNEFKKKMG